MEKEQDKMILIGTASFIGDVGYGSVYKYNVNKTIFGNLDEKSISLTVLASDKENLAFMSSHLDSGEFEMGCKRLKDNEPYSLLPISGFVDKNKTSWEIQYLKEL